jgi:hypothetical protein
MGNKRRRFFCALAIFGAFPAIACAEDVIRELRVGRAGHAFDHVGGISDQADAAAASGATIIYASGFGSHGYQGLPSPDGLAAERRRLADYNRRANERGIKLIIGYLCATSIVGLDKFDGHWTAEFRGQFTSPPSDWMQQDRRGRPLASWYGGEYRPACMNHPDWRKYESFMVRQSLETGHDGVFFDNPTVHPQGCYCAHCMRKWAATLADEGVITDETAYSLSTEAIRELADAHPKQFRRFRTTIAREFLTELRRFARTVNPNALVTCNNSLNAPDRLFAQCRTHAYNIHEMSKAEDFVVVEDMVAQPRIETNGQSVEYGPTFKQLHAISHGKPIVAVTLAGADYHTPPNLMRLAMAEAAAHQASYLSWPTWPEENRERMIAAVRPQADFLRENEAALNDAAARADVILFLPFRRWLETDQCTASSLAAALTNANVQYIVVSEDNLRLLCQPHGAKAFLIESRNVLEPDEAKLVAAFEQTGGRTIVADNGDWLRQVKGAVGAPSVVVDGPSTVRAVAYDQQDRTIVHLYSLNIQRSSSFEDRVTPVTDLTLGVTVPWDAAATVVARTADRLGSSGPLKFKENKQGSNGRLDIAIPRLEISALIVIQRSERASE